MSIRHTFYLTTLIFAKIDLMKTPQSKSQIIIYKAEINETKKEKELVEESACR